MAAFTQVNRPAGERGTLQALLESAAGGALPEWQRVVDGIVIRRLEAGEVVFLQDVEHPYLYGVRAGLLKLSYLNEDGAEWIKSFIGEESFFASLSALAPGGRTSFMAMALESSVLEQVDYRLLAELADRDMAWARARQAMTLAFAVRKERRERELLTLSAEGRYRAFLEASPDLERRIPQKELARYLGVTPVGLNRIVARVRRSTGAASQAEQRAEGSTCG